MQLKVATAVSLSATIVLSIPFGHRELQERDVEVIAAEAGMRDRHPALKDPSTLGLLGLLGLASAIGGGSSSPPPAAPSPAQAPAPAQPAGN